MFATLLAAGASDSALGEPSLSPVGPSPSYGRAASRAGLIVCNHQEQTDDLSFAARHAPYELLERRGFAAHPCAARYT